MEDIALQVINVDDLRVWNGRGPRALVIIPAHSDDRRHCLQGLEYFWATNVAGMNNALSAYEGCYSRATSSELAATSGPCCRRRIPLPIDL